MGTMRDPRQREADRDGYEATINNLRPRDLNLGDVVTYQKTVYERHSTMHVVKKDHRGITLYRPYMTTQPVSPTEVRWTMTFEELWFDYRDKATYFRIVDPMVPPGEKMAVVDPAEDPEPFEPR